MQIRSSSQVEFSSLKNQEVRIIKCTRISRIKIQLLLSSTANKLELFLEVIFLN